MKAQSGYDSPITGGNARTSVPLPTFVSLCRMSYYERRKQRDTSNFMNLVWFWI